jgi:hypothetical protein
MAGIPDKETKFIREAAKYLETPNLVHRLGGLIGRPIDKSLELLPEPAKLAIHRASQKAIEAALRASLATLGSHTSNVPFEEAVQGTTPTRLLHGAGSAITGALGGFFGLASFAVELPITTTLMLRSISRIAVGFGEDLDSHESQLECLYVFTLGGPTPGDDEAESAYYAGRLVFSEMISRAIHFLADKSVLEISRAVESKSAPMLVDLIVKVASRFEINVGRKALSQLIPGIGAGIGAMVNVAFMEHFNETAKYHFGLRRLERQYGMSRVQEIYRQAKQTLKAG